MAFNIIGEIGSDMLQVGDAFQSEGSESLTIAGLNSCRLNIDDDGRLMEVGDGRNIPGVGEDSRSRSAGRSVLTDVRCLDRVFVEGGEVSVESSTTVRGFEM